MANQSRFSIAKHQMEKVFDKNSKQIYTPNELQIIYSEHNLDWRLASSHTAKKMIEFLVQNSKLKEIVLDFPKNKVTRYCWGTEQDETIYELALSVKPDSYLSHYTAVYIHNLTEQIPKTIFVTYEQSVKPSNGSGLTQKDIDAAYSKPARVTTNEAIYKGYTITLINGKNTGNTGVLTSKLPDSSNVRVTNLERTLIDIAVRPEYSGGVREVLKAYDTAKERVQINRLNAYLKKINYIYPFHQVVGFYLDKIGFPIVKTAFLRSEWERVFDFYLEHNMQEKAYSDKWKLFYPAHL